MYFKKALRSHLKKEKSNKALVLSFHGWTGTGKNYVAKFIAESLFKKGMKSGFVQIFISTVNFPDHSKVDIYKIELQKKIMDTVRGLYLFFNQDIFLPSISLKTKLYSQNIFHIFTL